MEVGGHEKKASRATLAVSDGREKQQGHATR